MVDRLVTADRLVVAKGSELFWPLLNRSTAAAAEAEASAVRAANSADSAQAIGRYFPSRAAGEAGSQVGEPFSTDDGNGIIIYYRRTAGGSVEIGRAPTQASVNALARMVRATVSVDDFGAAGTDTGDDGPAIIAAQNHLIELGGGELLFSMDKIYRVVTPIPMENGVTYKGSGSSGINQVLERPGAKIIAAGAAVFVNSDETRHEIMFQNLFIHSQPGGGHIFDWSEDGVTAKVEIAGCTFIQENPGKHIIRGAAHGGVFSIWMHHSDYQYATGNTVAPLSFVSMTVNSIVIEEGWSTCTTAQTSGVPSIYFESANPEGPAINCIVRDIVFELPGGGSVKMQSCVQSGIENCSVYDLFIPGANPQFEIGDGASGPPSNNCWVRGVRSNVGTASVPDCRIDCSVPGQSAFLVDQCSFSVLDGGSATPGILVFGSDIPTFQNIAYTQLGGSAARDLHFGSTDPSSRSWTIWNGYPGNAPGYLSIDRNGSYVGAFSPTGLFQWGGSRTAPGFYVNAAGVPTAPSYNVGGFKVVGERGPAVADATDAASAVTAVNAVLARLRTHGLIAP